MLNDLEQYYRIFSFISLIQISPSVSLKCIWDLFLGTLRSTSVAGSDVAQASVDGAAQHSPRVQQSLSDVFAPTLSSKLRSVGKV